MTNRSRNIKVTSLDDYQRNKVLEALGDEKGGQLPAEQITALLKAAGISTTASQVRALSTHLGGDAKSAPRDAFRALLGTAPPRRSSGGPSAGGGQQAAGAAAAGAARSERNSADTSYGMLQKLKELRAKGAPPALEPGEQTRGEAGGAMAK